MMYVQSGCVECVWDIYRRELLAYEKAVAISKGAPEPLDPFEAMERRLYGETYKPETQE